MSGPCPTFSIDYHNFQMGERDAGWTTVEPGGLVAPADESASIHTILDGAHAEYVENDAYVVHGMHEGAADAACASGSTMGGQHSTGPPS